jgi:hypothetical protein
MKMELNGEPIFRTFNKGNVYFECKKLREVADHGEGWT